MDRSIALVTRLVSAAVGCMLALATLLSGAAPSAHAAVPAAPAAAPSGNLCVDGYAIWADSQTQTPTIAWPGSKPPSLASCTLTTISRSAARTTA